MWNKMIEDLRVMEAYYIKMENTSLAGQKNWRAWLKTINEKTYIDDFTQKFSKK